MVEHLSSAIPTAPTSDEISDAVILHTPEDTSDEKEKIEDQTSTNPLKAVLEASSKMAHRISAARKKSNLSRCSSRCCHLGFSSRC